MKTDSKPGWNSDGNATLTVFDYDAADDATDLTMIADFVLSYDSQARTVTLTRDGEVVYTKTV